MSPQGINTDTNSVDRLFPQQSVVETNCFLMTQGSAHEFFPQQNWIDSTDALIIQDQRHDQNQFMSS